MRTLLLCPFNVFIPDRVLSLIGHNLNMINEWDHKGAQRKPGAGPRVHPQPRIRLSRQLGADEMPWNSIPDPKIR